MRAHNAVLSASKLILGNVLFLRSVVGFTHRLGADAQIPDRPHLDGEFRRPAEHKLKFTASACTGPTTTLLQNPLAARNLNDDGRLVSVRNLSARFRREPLSYQNSGYDQ